MMIHLSLSAGNCGYLDAAMFSDLTGNIPGSKYAWYVFMYWQEEDREQSIKNKIVWCNHCFKF